MLFVLSLSLIILLQSNVISSFLWFDLNYTYKDHAPESSQSLMSGSVIMPIVHIVLFEFKPSVESEVIQDVSLQRWWVQAGSSITEPRSIQNIFKRMTRAVADELHSAQVCRRMISLRQQCINPTTKKPYILDSTGGRDHSPEGHQVVINAPILNSSCPTPMSIY
jgi:hypothetical protein